MSNAAKLKKRAIELEQKKQLDKALALYVQFLQESDGALDDVDVPLYNRVGDLMLRIGNVSDALNYYEKAVDLYAERGFHNNAIALCNKVLRQSPGRASIYYKLGKISATKGFKSDAKKNFLEYADRMQKAGQIDEAFRALKEFADLCPDQDDIRLMLAEQLSKENRQDEALEQLQKLHDKLDSEGRSAEARATVDRMKSIDPEAVPRTSGTYRAQKSTDLIFLDTSFGDQAPGRHAPARHAPARPTPARPAPARPAPARKSAPTPAGRQVSDPDLVVLTLGDQANASVSPVPHTALEDAFDLDLATPPAGETVGAPAIVSGSFDAARIDPVDLAADAGSPRADVAFDLPMLEDASTIEARAEVIDVIDVPALADAAESAASDVELLDMDAFAAVEPASSAGAPAEASPFGNASDGERTDAELAAVDIERAAASAHGLEATHEPEPVDITARSPYETGASLGIDYAADLAVDAGAAQESALSTDDLFDFRAPPRTDDSAMASEPLSGLDPDVSFPSLDDMALPSADEITSGGSLAAALGGAFSLGVDDPGIDDGVNDGGDAPAAGDSLLGAGFDDAVASSDESPFQQDPGALLEAAFAADAAAAAAPDDATADLSLDWPAAADIVPSARPSDDESAEVDIGDFALDAQASADESAHASAQPSAHVSETEASGAPGAVLSLDEPAFDVVDESAERRSVDARDDAAADGGIIGAATAATATPNESRLANDDRRSRARTPAPATPAATPAATPPATPPADAAVPLAPHRDRWEERREQAERLLDSGDRAAGVDQLEQMAAELERAGDLERAQTIVDELIRLSPDCVRHHQKRVELAFRAGDRPKLIDAYMELGDALFRSGEERKARAVYQRVLELAPDDVRARVALDSVDVSGPTGSGSMSAITPPSSPSRAEEPSRPSVQPPPAAAVGPASANGRAVSQGLTNGSGSSRKPSPLDRTAASGDFVDLGEWIRSSEAPKSTRMVAEEKPPTGDEQADFQEMLKRFKQGIAENVDEEDYDSHYDLGVAYKEMGLMDEAVAEFQKALRGTAHRVRAYEALGQCFVEKEQFQVASSVLTRAMALGEGDDHHLIGVLYLLGRATEALDRPTAALDYYQRVFAVDIEFRDVADRISEIARKAT